MPRFRITAPDGKTYEVTAPDGASQADVMAFVQSQAGTEPAPMRADPAAAMASERERLDAERIGEMSGAGKFFAGVGRGFHDVGRGLQQLDAQVGEAIGAYAPGEHAKRTAAGTEELDLYEPLRRDSPVLTGAGRILGNVAAMPVPVGRGATLLGTAARAGAAGAVQGGAGFVREGESRLGNAALGATIGAALPPALRGAKLTVAGVRDVATWLKGMMPNATQSMREQVAARIIREAAADPAALARAANPAQHVAGVRPSLGEATDDLGIAGLQRAMMNTEEFATRMGQQQQGNNAARVGAIRGAFGGADEGSAAAIEAQRDALTAPLIDQARRAVPRVEARAKEAGTILQGVIGQRMPSADFDIVKEGQKIARAVASGKLTRDEGLDAMNALSAQSKTVAQAMEQATGRIGAGVKVRPVVKLADRILKKREGNRSVSAVVADVRDLIDSAGDDVARLHNVRQEIGYILGGQSQTHGTAGKAAASELMSIRQALDSQINKAAPQFGQFMKLFADMSRGAGRVRVGAELLEKSSPTLDALGNPILSPAKFGNAARDLDRVAKAATGFRKESAARLLEPGQQQVIGAVKSDLDRLARLQQGGAVKSDTYRNLMSGQALRNAAADDPASSLAKSMAARVPFIGWIADRFGKQTIEVLQNAVADPNYAVQLLAKFPPQQRRQIAQAMQSGEFQSLLGQFAPSAGAAAFTGP